MLRKTLNFALLAGFMIVLTQPHPALSGVSPVHNIVITGGKGNDDTAAASAADRLRSVLNTKSKQIKSITLSGRFLITSPINIINTSGVRIDGQRQTIFLASSAAVSDAIRAQQADNIYISGISFFGFRDNGIFIKDSKNVIIDHVSVKETHSSKWSQGAIHLTGNVQNSRIINNEVTGADFAGIVVDTTKSSNVTGMRIIGNFVTDTCRIVKDCGAIYINDRGRRSRDILIANNNIFKFGDYSVGGRGIYIDDWASNVIARRNRISGKGRFAFEIHGGNNNIITENKIDMGSISQFLLYEEANDGIRAVMANNKVYKNVLSIPEQKTLITTSSRDRQGLGAVHFWRNQLCVANHCAPIQ